MNIEQIKEKVKSSEYSFLRTNPHLNDNVCLLALGGSYAYGTNTENSDLDVRGVALNTKEEILTNDNFDQFINSETDTTIYSFNKIIKLLLNCNPNTIELLGCKPEHYLYTNGIGKELLKNSNLFLSKRAIFSFGGYATQQLRRLENKSNRERSQSEQEIHILRTIQDSMFTYRENYFSFPDDSIKLYIDKAIQDNIDTEIFMDINLKHYPLRDYKSMWSEMQNTVKAYAKIGDRNNTAIEKDKLGKHMMHLIRLYMMCIDILEKEEIITYREKEHNLLMDIRNNKYLNEDKQPIKEFYEMLDEFEKRLDYAKTHTCLPDAPDYKKVNEFVMSVNERIVNGMIKD